MQFLHHSHCCISNLLLSGSHNIDVAVLASVLTAVAETGNVGNHFLLFSCFDTVSSLVYHFLYSHFLLAVASSISR